MSKQDLEIIAANGDPMAISYDFLRSLPPFARVDDVRALDKAAPEHCTAAVLSALIADDDRKGARSMLLEGADGHSARLPLDEALERAVVIYQKDRQPLSPADGGPFRLFIVDAAACKTAPLDKCATIKGLCRITLSKEPLGA
ncbi:MAG: hypothetical protein RLY93_04680 [Sumerlaeia bacterium]